MAGKAIGPRYKEGTDYIVKTIGGTSLMPDKHKNYECVNCMFATIDANAMNDHLFREDHRWPWPEYHEDGRKINFKHPDLTKAEETTENG